MPAGALASILVEGAVAVVEAVLETGGEVRREPFEAESWGVEIGVFRGPEGILQAVWERLPATENLARAVTTVRSSGPMVSRDPREIDMVGGTMYHYYR